jgi:hypothetical protein
VLGDAVSDPVLVIGTDESAPWSKDHGAPRATWDTGSERDQPEFALSQVLSSHLSYDRPDPRT